MFCLSFGGVLRFSVWRSVVAEVPLSVVAEQPKVAAPLDCRRLRGRLCSPTENNSCWLRKHLSAPEQGTAEFAVDSFALDSE